MRKGHGHKLAVGGVEVGQFRRGREGGKMPFVRPGQWYYCTVARVGVVVPGPEQKGLAHARLAGGAELVLAFFQN